MEPPRIVGFEVPYRSRGGMNIIEKTPKVMSLLSLLLKESSVEDAEVYTPASSPPSPKVMIPPTSFYERPLGISLPIPIPERKMRRKPQSKR
jgi:hypothetical protein